MAAALGARVSPGGAGKEIGWSALSRPQVPPAANPLSALFRRGVRVLHWHGDTFDLPAGVTRLAGSVRYPNQAFAVATHALALQFHAEVQSALLERWYIGHATELIQAGIDIPALRAAGLRFGPRLQRVAASVWSQWLAGIARAPAPRQRQSRRRGSRPTARSSR
jgi:GMP synthase (glutamine-hydrolysing)